MSRNRDRRPITTGTLTSNGYGVRLKGSAPQLAEKYDQLSREATFDGDKMGAELHAQHAEHYRRVASAAPPFIQ